MMGRKQAEDPAHTGTDCMLGSADQVVSFLQVPELWHTWERRPELIQLVLVRLADMVDACWASCMDPSRAPSYSAWTTHAGIHAQSARLWHVVSGVSISLLAYPR